MAKLRAYKAKRRFTETTEPEGKVESTATGSLFVVHKHHARRMHYDLRLEFEGTLKCWAVPEGPCLDTKVRRLAVQTEDHPVSYATFEGRIPEGNYGAGGTIVWDKGDWATAQDFNEGLARGEIKFRLHGEKLRGGWALVRLADSPKNWLLIKERDAEARPLADYDVLKEAPRSVLSGLLVEDFDAPAEASVKRKAGSPARLKGAIKAALPDLVAPQLPTLVASVPAGEDWLHEIKYDGYRTLARIDGGTVRLITRNGHDWTKRYGVLADAFKALLCKSALIDGEIVVQDAKGASKIGLLEDALSHGRSHEFTFFAFDLIYLDGYDLSAVPLHERKAALKALIGPHLHAHSAIQYSDHIEGEGAALFANASRIGLEGIVSKKRNAKYTPGRSASWLKIKHQEVGSFAVIGFTTSGPKHVAALVLAERGPALRYCGKVGSGFSDRASQEVFARLSPAAIDRPAVEVPRMPDTVWIDPDRFDAEVIYRDVTPSGALRHATFAGLSEHRGAIMKPKLVKDSDLAAIHLTNPEREMFEGSGATKLDIALYYARVADWMLPDLFNRPVSLIRCPTGKLGDCFYQRHAFAGLPPGVSTIDLKEEEGRNAYVYIKDARGFLALSQFGVVEFHPWACRVDEPDKPDRLIIDLDPAPDVAWPQVLRAAEVVRERANGLGLVPFARTTGGKGMHVVVPLVRGHSWAMHKSFSQGIAKALAKENPRLFTASPVKSDRKGRIFLDYGRNFRGSTAVASFSLRARVALTVATPVAWEELSGIVGPEAFDRKSVPARLARLSKDPWADFDGAAAAITQKARRDIGLKD